MAARLEALSSPCGSAGPAQGCPWAPHPPCVLSLTACMLGCSAPGSPSEHETHAEHRLLGHWVSWYITSHVFHVVIAFLRHAYMPQNIIIMVWFLCNTSSEVPHGLHVYWNCLLNCISKEKIGKERNTPESTSHLCCLLVGHARPVSHLSMVWSWSSTPAGSRSCVLLLNDKAVL